MDLAIRGRIVKLLRQVAAPATSRKMIWRSEVDQVHTGGSYTPIREPNLDHFSQATCDGVVFSKPSGRDSAFLKQITRHHCRD